MGNTLRKLVYGILFVVCLALGITGINTPSGSTIDTSKDVHINCSITKEVYTDSSNQTVDYVSTSNLTLTIRENVFLSKAVNETQVYKSKDRYTSKKDSLIKAGAKYEFDDNNITIKLKKSLEKSVLDGVKPNVNDVKTHLKSLGYKCN